MSLLRARPPSLIGDGGVVLISALSSLCSSLDPSRASGPRQRGVFTSAGGRKLGTAASLHFLRCPQAASLACVTREEGQ